MKHFPANAGVQLLVFPLDGTRDDYITLPNGRIQGIAFTTAATTGTPTSVTVTVSDNNSTPNSVATVITQAARAIKEATIPTAGWAIDSDLDRQLKIATTFDGGTTPTWKGSILIQFSPGNP